MVTVNRSFLTVVWGSGKRLSDLVAAEKESAVSSRTQQPGLGPQTRAATHALSFWKTARLKMNVILTACFSPDVFVSLDVLNSILFGSIEMYIHSLGNVFLQLSADRFGARPDKSFCFISSTILHWADHCCSPQVPPMMTWVVETQVFLGLRHLTCPLGFQNPQNCFRWIVTAFPKAGLF